MNTGAGPVYTRHGLELQPQQYPEYEDRDGFLTFLSCDMAGSRRELYSIKLLWKLTIILP